MRPVTVIEFADFQCPFCKRSEDAVKAIHEKYGDRIQLVFMDFPLSFHPHAMPAANAARCANAQGKFWQYHDALFADQSKLEPADLEGDRQDARARHGQVQRLLRQEPV